MAAPALHLERIVLREGGTVPSDAAARRLRSALASCGSIALVVPGYGRRRKQIAAMDRELFDQARGHDRPSEARAFSFGLEEDRRRSNLRGWKRRGETDSGADKAYFQFGITSGTIPACDLQIRRNVWPEGAFGGEYRRLKHAELRLHQRVHFAVGRVLHGNRFGRTRATETIGRVTRYCGGLVGDCGADILNPAHVDLSDTTIATFEPGLQFGDRSTAATVPSRWFDLPSSQFCEDTVIFFLGLATEIATAGRLRAAWHRVRANPDSFALRHSMVSFFNAGVGDVLRPCAAKSPVTYPEISRDELHHLGNRRYRSMLQRSSIGSIAIEDRVPA